MKVWIVALVILVLAVLILRERYTNYEQALKDVGQSAGYITPKCEEGYTINSELSSCEKPKPDGTKETKTPTCPSGSSFVRRGTRGICEPSSSEPPAPVSSSTSSNASATEPTPTGAESEPDYTTHSCPTGYTWDMISRKCKKQVEATCPSGFELSNVGCKNVNGENIVPPTCAENGVFDPVTLKCIVYTAGTTTTTSGTTTPGTTTPSPSTTTGGSSGNLIGPTSGGGGALSGKNVWGPIFVGLGESASGSAVDSTKTREYPELLGGNSGKSSARIDGVGIVSPSQPGFGLDLGVLPSTASLGTDPLSRFLPFSRQPGDMDVVADPYRLANSYSTKNFSSEKDPVPFLTDFSAFYR